MRSQVWVEGGRREVLYKRNLQRTSMGRTNHKLKHGLVVVGTRAFQVGFQEVGSRVVNIGCDGDNILDVFVPDEVK